MKHILFIAVFSALIGLVACGDKQVVTDVLNRAEKLMDEHPDSSLVLLRTLTFDDFRKESNRARYALLHSQALDKNYIDVTSDSLISVAVEYYKDKDDVRGKFLSCYYMGRVHANGERYLQATSCLMESEQLVDEVGDDYLSGLLYSEMGRIYRLYYDYPKSLEAHQKAAEYYERAGKIGHRNYMWYYQSSVYREMNRDNEGERMLKKVLESTKSESDNTLIAFCKGSLVMLCIKQGRMEEAHMLYEQWKTLVGIHSASSSFMAELSSMFAKKRDFIQAEICLKQGWERAVNRTDSINLCLSTAEMYYFQGREKEAYNELLKGVTWQTEEIRQILQQPILTAQRDYLAEKLEYEAYRLQMEKHLRILYIFIFVLLLSLVVFVLYRKLHKEKEKARKTIDGLHAEIQLKEQESHQKITSLLQELENRNQSDVTIEYLRSELENREDNLRRYIREAENIQLDLQRIADTNAIDVVCLFRERMELIGEMVLSFEEKKDSNINEEIRWWKGKYLVGKKAVAELERQVNLYCQDAMCHFRREMSMNEEADYHWVCYLFAGVSIKTIAWLMKENKGSIYQRRLRLRSEIESSDCLHKELYLRLLGK